MSYILRFPFKLAEHQELSNVGQSHITESLGLQFDLRKEEGGFYILKIGGFKNESEGKYYIEKVWAGFMWALLNRDISPEAELIPQEIQFRGEKKNKVEVKLAAFGEFIKDAQGFIDGSRPAVYKQERRIVTCNLMSPTYTVGYPPEKFLSLLSEALSFRQPEYVFKDKKLSLALELYNSYHREISGRSKFLTLMMILEVLAPVTKKHRCALELLEKWRIEINTYREKVKDCYEKKEAFDSLEKEVIFRKEKSVRSRIRNYVQETLSSLDNIDAKRISKRALELYDMRSKLVHKGKIKGEDIGKLISELKDIVVQILKIQYRVVAD